MRLSFSARWSFAAASASARAADAASRAPFERGLRAGGSLPEAVARRLGLDPGALQIAERLRKTVLLLRQGALNLPALPAQLAHPLLLQGRERVELAFVGATQRVEIAVYLPAGPRIRDAAGLALHGRRQARSLFRLVLAGAGILRAGIPFRLLPPGKPLGRSRPLPVSEVRLAPAVDPRAPLGVVLTGAACALGARMGLSVAFARPASAVPCVAPGGLDPLRQCRDFARDL